MYVFFFSSRRRHTRLQGDWSSDVCSSDLPRSQTRRMPSSIVTTCAKAAAANSPTLWPITASTSRPKIGRASCREKVEVTGDAGTVKKRKSANKERDRSENKGNKEDTLETM